MIRAGRYLCAGIHLMLLFGRLAVLDFAGLFLGIELELAGAHSLALVFESLG